MQQCRYGLASGRVQGVGYRQFVQAAAQREGVSGWARNLPDGQVELLLCGPDDAVDRVAAEAAQGPALAQVSNIEWEQRAERDVTGFRTY